MNLIIKKCPIPIVGLILGLAATGNLVQSYGMLYRNFFGILSAIILVFIVIKMIKFPRSILQSLDNPVVASVIPTFSMAIMLLSTYLKPFASTVAYVVWLIGLIVHVSLIFLFTKRYVFHFNIKQVFPSWFIVYVGIVVSSVTAPVYGMESIGIIAFWFGFVTYFILLPIIIYRVKIVREMQEPTLPTLAIFAAPASLLLAGYMNTFVIKNTIMVGFLMILSIIMYVVVIAMLFKLLQLKFYPSYSGFTFPLVISGISIKLANGYLRNADIFIPSLQYFVYFQEVVGMVITLYVFFRYIQFIVNKEPSHA